MRPGKPGWRSASARYLAVIAVIHLVWEGVQLPLYTLWTEGTRAAQVFAVLHCTAGDVLIAAGDYRGAEEAFSIASESGASLGIPQSDLHDRLARVRAKTGRFAEALDELLAAARAHR